LVTSGQARNASVTDQSQIVDLAGIRGNRFVDLG
jgi:hypothetical protein